MVAKNPKNQIPQSRLLPIHHPIPPPPYSSIPSLYSCIHSIAGQGPGLYQQYRHHVIAQYNITGRGTTTTGRRGIEMSPAGHHGDYRAVHQ